MKIVKVFQFVQLRKMSGGVFVEGKYISNTLWKDSLLVKYSEFGYNDTYISSRVDC